MSCRSSFSATGPGRTGCSSSAHRFNLHPPLGTSTGRWETLPSLLQPRCDAAAVSRGSVVFLLGAAENRRGPQGTKLGCCLEYMHMYMCMYMNLYVYMYIFNICIYLIYIYIIIYICTYACIYMYVQYMYVQNMYVYNALYIDLYKVINLCWVNMFRWHGSLRRGEQRGGIPGGLEQGVAPFGHRKTFFPPRKWRNVGKCWVYSQYFLMK